MRVVVQPFEVGPILGAVSPTTARLWGRGSELRSNGTLRRCFGAARLKRAGQSYESPQYFKLNPNFDLTGVTVFQGLQPNTLYDYQIGAFYTEIEMDFDDVLADVTPDWTQAHQGQFRSASDDPAASRSFVFGSCRYLLKLFGGTLFDDRGDKTFRSILRQIDDDGRRTDQVLMLGDQIYADDLNFLFPDRYVDDYFERYREVFSQPHFRQLVSRIPTYMTLDDHEIENNWPAEASQGNLMHKFPAAMHAYLTYQLSHSPLFDYGSDGRLTEQPDHYWYTFEDGCCEFFVMDTRTERLYGDAGERIRIIEDEQMQALKDWLADGSERVKLIATAVPFFPDLEGAADRWDSFPAQRNELLEHIRTHRIRRVVFLAGDVHSSMSAELQHRDAPAFKVISVVSSPLYWPYPHGFSKAFQLTGGLAHAEGYSLNRGGPVHGTDNFARVTVSRSRVRVEFFKRKGEQLGATKTHTLAS